MDRDLPVRGRWGGPVPVAVAPVVVALVVVALVAGCQPVRPAVLSVHPATGRPAAVAVIRARPYPLHKVRVGKPYRIRGVWYHPAEDPDYDRTGIASWYGRRFHGRRTANGEYYDMHALTAAHPTLPLGSWVEVRNLENGRKVRLRINDRGPFVKGRIIDVSRRAAEILGMRKKGLARVRVRIIADPGKGQS